jgi:formate C-acetyltransferase
MAVYELVYEKKIVSLLELKTALEQDWKGYELLQRKALNCKHKYGLGDKLSDSYANKIVTFIHEVISKLKNGHQCKYALEIHSAKTFIWHGDKTMATPDGRNYGDELSKNASPHPGSDKLGVTALINSATTIDTSLADMGFCLDVMLHPTSLMGDNGLDVLHQLVKTYMYKRGHSIHFNVFNVDTLRDAQLNPTKYENLQVRVCGWNVLWNNMNKKEQDAYILRAKNIYNES